MLNEQTIVIVSLLNYDQSEDETNVLRLANDCVVKTDHSMTKKSNLKLYHPSTVIVSNHSSHDHSKVESNEKANLRQMLCESLKGEL